MKIHLLAVILAALAGVAGRIEPWAWAALAMACALVVASEMLNTAIERLCDRITADQDALIRDIKDISSGAVLVCAIFAVAIAVIVFARPVVWGNFLSRI